MRLALEVDAVLEGAGLALVAVDRHQPRSLLGAHQAPLAPRREAGAAQAPQAAVGQRRDHVVHLAHARQARAQHGIAARCHIRLIGLVRRHRRMRLAARGQLDDLGDACMIDMMVADLDRRRRVAGADARRPQHAHIRHFLALQGRQQPLGAGQHAAQAVADAHRHLRRARLAVRHDIEVGVEGRDLVDLGHRDLELFGQRLQMPLRQATLLVLDQVQILDQQRTLTRARREQRLDGRGLLGLQHPTFGKGSAFAPPRAWMDGAARIAPAAARRLRCVVHSRQPVIAALCSGLRFGIPYTSARVAVEGARATLARRVARHGVVAHHGQRAVATVKCARVRGWRDAAKGAPATAWPAPVMSHYP